MKLFFGTLFLTIILMLVFDSREDFYSVEITKNSGKVDTVPVSKFNYDRNRIYTKIVAEKDSSNPEVEKFRIASSEIRSKKIVKEFHFP